MRWILVTAVLMVGVSCTAPCSPSNCDGCCASDGVCVPGTSRFECGLDGAECTRCESNQSCSSRACLTADAGGDAGVDRGDGGCDCSATCCYGDGTCAPNNEPTACGAAGSFCGACAEGERCESGLCVSSSCGGCFTPVGTCAPGNQASACGSDAGICASCLTDQACVAGACIFTRCDATNCRFGCCMPDKRCETAVGVEACGLNGSACDTCQPDGGVCVSGVCQ